MQSTAIVRRPHELLLAVGAPPRQYDLRHRAQESHLASHELDRGVPAHRRTPASYDPPNRSVSHHRRGRQLNTVVADLDGIEVLSESNEAPSGQMQHNKSRRTFKNMVSHGAQLNGDVLVDSAHLSRIQMDHQNCEAGRSGLQSNGCISENNMRTLIENFNFSGRS